MGGELKQITGSTGNAFKNLTGVNPNQYDPVQNAMNAKSAPPGSSFGGGDVAMSPDQMAYNQKAIAQQKQMQNTPGTILQPLNQNEINAGVTPASFQGTVDPATGKLLDQYSLNPYGGEALQSLKKTAFSQGLSPYAQTQMDLEKTQEAQAAGQAGQQAMGGAAAARANAQRQGGLGGGAAAMLENQGQRNALNALQGVAGQGAQSRLGISATDLQNKQALMGQLGNLETSTNTQNLGTLTNNLANLQGFNQNRYNAQMAAYGANKQAQATAAAGGGGGGGKK